MKKPKILIALFRFPYPSIDGTRYKILNNVIEGLHQDFDVEFFITTIDSYVREQIDYLEKNFGKVHVFQHSLTSFLMNAVPVLWKWIPFQAQSFHFSDADHWLQKHRGEYDAFYVHEIRMTEYFMRFPENLKQKVVVDFNDAISLHYRESIQNLNIFKKLFYRVEGFLVKHYEQKVLKAFHYFNIVSEYDRKYLLGELDASQRGIQFTAVHHGMPQVSHRASMSQTEQNIFFLGRLGYEPNRDAVLFFLRHIWQPLKKALPNIKFFIIGKHGALQKYPNYQDVVFTGFVPEVWDILNKCSLMVAPIRFAGGTPSKVLESMSYGIPVITTPTAAKGIDGLIHRKNALIVSEENSSLWVSEIASFFHNAELRSQLADNAVRFVQENYSSEVAQRQLRELFHNVISKDIPR